MDRQLVALFELRRQGFLLGYVQNPSLFDDAHAFAIQNRIAPIFHENIQREVHGGDPFEELYSVGSEFVTAVLRYVDERWLAKDFESLGFYKLEDHFGGYKANRIELLYALKYFRIDGRFDDQVWQAIEADAPVEASSIDHEFLPKNVYFD